MSATIKDVARRAGVSITTVSHVVSEGPNRARYAPETVKRVLDAARRLRYAPSRRAHNMRKGMNQVVSIFSSMTSENESGYSSMIFTGAAMALRESGYSVELVNPARESDILHVLENTDGVIFSVDARPEAIRVVQASKRPFVRLNLGLCEPEDCVEPDDRAGAGMLGEHVAALGYERIFYVKASRLQGHASIRIREKALAEAVAGRSFESLVLDPDILRPVIRDLCRHALPRTVFVAYADSIRIVLQQMFFRAGLLIPDDVGLASCHTGMYGNTVSMDLPVTGTTYRVTELGAAGARMLLDRIRAGGRSMPAVLVPETFIEGVTTRRQCDDAPVQERSKT